METKKEVIIKIGDKVIIPSKRYNDFEKKLEGYRARGIVIKFNPELNKYLIRFTYPEDEIDFEKYFKASEFRKEKKKS